MTGRSDDSRDCARLLAKLESVAPLSGEDRAALAGLPLRVQAFDEKTDIVRQGDVPRECALVLEGFVARYRLLGTGQRQIVAIHMPGDLPDLQSLHLGVMDHSVGALSPVRIGFIPHAAMHDLIRARPGVADALWRDTLIDAAGFREWLAGLGRRSAHQRIAHLLCELYVKLRAVGLAAGDGFDLPVTQLDLADTLGLSSVHVNRVLQDLRREGLITSRGRFVGVPDSPRLMAAADFDSAYLHLRRPADGDG